MRARLKKMNTGQEFIFLCAPKMAEKMDGIVSRGGGQIFSRDIRSYGVVISVRKN